MPASRAAAINGRSRFAASSAVAASATPMGEKTATAPPSTPTPARAAPPSTPPTTDAPRASPSALGAIGDTTDARLRMPATPNRLAISSDVSVTAVRNVAAPSIDPVIA